MPFNSIDFAIFLPLVFGLYWWIGSQRVNRQNELIVLASYVFYGWWDWRCLALILLSSLVDYAVGRGLGATEDPRRRRWLLGISLVVNLGLLATFKYYGFFIESLVAAFSLFGLPLEGQSLGLVLPVGISFYTFQTLSYAIDVYQGRLRPTRDLVAFLAFVSFFPQLVAGPIERASHLLPQFHQARHVSYQSALNGCQQILWGLFKKMVIADNCALIVNQTFSPTADDTGSTLVLGAVMFSFQIYGDFSGYSDIAIGTARLFGFSLKQNFAFPYFSRDVAEFWRRWHISLSSWFRDYVYIPLGGSRGSRGRRIRNTVVVFLLSGFWHGANWTFIVWGGLHALLFLPLLLRNRTRQHPEIVAVGRKLPSWREAAQMLLTFTLISFAWIFFRADDLGHAIDYFTRMASGSLWALPYVFGVGTRKALLIFGLVSFFLIVEWLGRRQPYAIAALITWPTPWSWLAYYVLVMLIFLFAAQEQAFIYFQF
jgi:D-alanyl-lipoteichoic acid acyltransferase DltB (MBOAT superfamily)